MRTIFFPLAVFFLLCSRGYAEQKMGAVEIYGELEASLAFEYRAQEKSSVFDVPIHGNPGIVYETANVKSVVSLDFDSDLKLGETYIRGGSSYSYFQAGYYTENWGQGYSVSVVDQLNERDTAYPMNLFYQKYKSPNPLFTVLFGDKGPITQIALSNKADSIDSIDDTVLGMRALTVGSGFTVGLGMIRCIGYPPPLFFLTAEKESENNRAWMELGWRYRKSSPDRVNFVIGSRQDFSSASLIAEFIVESSHPLLYLEERSTLSDQIDFELRGFVYLPTLSNALNGFFIIAFDKNAELEIGGFLFFGKEGSYFSRYESGNNNSLYLKLHFEY